MIVQGNPSKSLKRKLISLITCHSPLSVFMMNDMSSGMKTHCESTEPESHQMDK